MRLSRTFRFLALLLVLSCTAGCDQATKHLARSGLAQPGSTTFCGHSIELTLAENPGAFLSLGASLPPAARSAILTAGVSFALACLLAYLVSAPGLSSASFWGLALSWAGGASNLFDRFTRHGLVTDFMVFRLGPLHTGVFNLADLAIVAGMVIVAASLLVHSRKRWTL